MRNISKLACLLAVVMLSLSGCVKENGGVEPQEEEYRTVTFKFGCGADTRSQLSSALAQAIKTARLYVYDSNGYLYGSVAAGSGQSVQMAMEMNDTYSVYVLANMQLSGEPPVLESDFVKRTYAVSISSAKVLGIPMCGHVTADNALLSTGTVSVELTRLFARVCLTIDFSGLSESHLNITSASVRQVATKVAPFSGPYRAVGSVADGDFATPIDVNALNNSQTVTFYVPENDNGVLLPGNDNPAMKDPAYVDRAAYCTYIEITAQHMGYFQGVSVNSENTTYRFFLGKDNVSDFSVERNQTLDIVLSVTDEGMYADGWKADYGAVLPGVSYDFVVEPTSFSMYKGLTRDVSAILYQVVDGVRVSGTDVSDEAVWNSSDPGVASVSAGLVQGESVGSCVITVTYGGETASVYVTVEDEISYGYRFHIVGDDTVLVGKDSSPYKMYYYKDTYTSGVLTSHGTTAYEYDGEVSWYIAEGSSFATISEYGVVHGTNAGNVKIIATVYHEGTLYDATKDIVVQKSSAPGTDTGWEDGGDVDYD